MGKTMNKPRQTAVAARGQTVTLRRAEYERLLAKAGETLNGEGPPLPKADARGNFPAVQYVRASIAREIIRRRKALGLSQTDLADAAGVRQETISNLETGKQTVTQRIMEAIVNALRKLESSAPKRSQVKRPR